VRPQRSIVLEPVGPETMLYFPESGSQQPEQTRGMEFLRMHGPQIGQCVAGLKQSSINDDPVGKSEQSPRQGYGVPDNQVQPSASDGLENASVRASCLRFFTCRISFRIWAHNFFSPPHHSSRPSANGRNPAKGSRHGCLRGGCHGTRAAKPTVRSSTKRGGTVLRQASDSIVHISRTRFYPYKYVFCGESVLLTRNN